MSSYPENLLMCLRAEPGVHLEQRATKNPTWWPGDAPQDKKQAAVRMKVLAVQLSDLQERLFAQALQEELEDSVLLILQGMDTSGKGGIVRHVMGMLDPQGVEHFAFKAPTAQEREHDFLWRVEKRLPARGRIGVFDRSHYEDVLIHRVQKLSTQAQVEARYSKIVEFEKRLKERGIHPVKVMLHISRDEQFARLSERLERPDKYWKYAASDVEDRLLWDEYQKAYQIAVNRTDNDAAPWYIIPADQKWRARLCVAELLLAQLQEIDPQWPAAKFDVAAERARLEAAR
ncbi:PPK2 family polyphosphate kinase [Glutamicibacter sp.]|uniref:PPK2 family polyphosphate kinase n=1 Tax=Glutamicibacter sp. TaxID=1931995 RepID=UPI0028BD83DC|nr:PPK2 family polyphosphate kinase [Glutamicibacter sp.]